MSNQDNDLPAIPNLPKHIGIIMDGNGRWAKLRGKRRIFGHEAGVIKAKELVEYSVKMQLKALTLYAFSSENWNRPKKEINGLMRLFERTIGKYTNLLIENNVCFKPVGNLQLLPEKLRRKLEQMEGITSENTGLKLNLAIAYGARYDIVESIKIIIDKLEKNELSKEEVNEDLVSEYLSFKDVPDLDLIIRTSGETRLSNFMLWQLAYAEIYFLDKLWPDFNDKDLKRVINDFKKIKRNFGSI